MDLLLSIYLTVEMNEPPLIATLLDVTNIPPPVATLLDAIVFLPPYTTILTIFVFMLMGLGYYKCKKTRIIGNMVMESALGYSIIFEKSIVMKL